MKAADFVARDLARRGVTHVFEISGGMIIHLLDAFYRHGAPRVVSMRHEQAAGFAAEGLTRWGGTPGVALATSGPGATNLLTAIGSFYFDSYPAVFLTGQVNRHELRGDRDVRQLGFQETDIVSMARPVTKAAWLVDAPERLPELMDMAFRVAQSGRPGPVLLDLPMDVQRAEIDADALARPPSPPCAVTEELDDDALQRAIDDLLASLGRARRPLILAGGGVRSGRVAEQTAALAEGLNLPVIHSLMATDVLAHDHRCRVGMLGTYGNRWANLAAGASDWLLVLGSRLDIRQTGADVTAFKAGRVIHQVDVHAGEMNQRVTGCHAVCAGLDRFLRQARRRLEGSSGAAREEWFAEIAALRERWPDTAEPTGVVGINPNLFMHELSRASRAAAAFVVDVGQHQMWAAQSLELGRGQRFLTSGGMGSMGFALPAAVGAAIGAAPRAVVVIAGDGGFQHNLQELQTVFHHRLPLKMVVLDNRCHGMVRQFQESYFDARYPSTVWGYSAPNFAQVAEAFGIQGRSVQRPEDVPAALAELWRDPSAPALLQVLLDQDTNVYPKIAFGRPFTEMEPQARPIEVEGT